MEFKLPEREQNSNKGTFGKVLNFAGSKNYIGAAYLSSLGAMKIGAGYVALSSDFNVINSVSKLLPETVFLSQKAGLKNINGYNVLLVGCGIGQGFKSKYYFKEFIKKALKYKLPIVIDADGLNILSYFYNKNDKEIHKFAQNEDKKIIITPHPVEASRLLNVEPEEVINNTENAAKELSKKYKCVTVLKTHRTIVCSKESEIYTNQHGNSALAKAGTGDVLAGIISGLLAQKMALFEAAKLGVYMHSRAGEIASENLTEYSVLASDIPQYLHFVIKELENK